MACNMELECKPISSSYSVDESMSVADTHIHDQMALPALPPPLPMSMSAAALQQQQQQPPLQQMPATSSVGTPEKNHLCTTCAKAFRSKQQLNQHSLVHTGIRKHDCAYCDKSFKQLSHLQQHIRIHTGETPEKSHMCPTCLKGFRSKPQLNQHNLVHSGVRKHDCPYCDKCFKQLSHLQQHIRIHTGEKPYKCAIDGCDRAFAQLSNLHHHLRNHDDQVKKAETRLYKCVICHRSYTNDSSLKTHTLKMHIHIKPIDVLAEMNSGVRPSSDKQKFFGTSTLQSELGADGLLLPQVLGLQKASGLADFQSSRVSQNLDRGVVRVPSITVCQKIIREECIELDENGDVINVTVDHRKLPQTEIIHNGNHHKVTCESQTAVMNDSGGGGARSLVDKQLMLSADSSHGSSVGGGGGSNNNNNNSTRPGLLSSPVSPPSHENHLSQLHHHHQQNMQLSPSSDKNSLSQRSHPQSIVGGIITSSAASSSSSIVPGADSIATSQNSRFAYLDQRGIPESYLMSMDATLRRNAFPIPLSRAAVGMEHLQGASPAHRPLDGHDFYGAHLPRLPLATHMHLSTSPSRMGESRTFTTLGN
ncbi:zinc finger protein 85-like isoform X2 [Gigantopelta aegis]|uniref:zinc finger protein 85-like isoform X2 n=1 Tax=Gigantopelta aegis TaxID=1735272 RepID=UPI001B88B1B4|nr:zinc finger protein 85-like isoform X2 [Gigantopelta aegis]